MEKKSTIVIILIIVVLAIAGLWVLKRPKNSQAPSLTGQTNQPSNGSNMPQPTVSLPFATKDAPEAKLPDGFIKGFPLETNAKILVNQSAQTAAGLQSTRVFVSQNSLAANYKIYSDYLKKNNWKILTSVDTETFKSISAKSQDNVSVDLSISQNSVTKNIEVNIVFLQSIKK